MPLGVSNPAVSLLIQGAHRPATLWKITREDGEEYRFTDHDTKLEFDGEEYTPVSGVTASARQKQDMLKARNIEVRGVIASDAITTADLRAGKFRGAILHERIVDWRYPWNEIGHQKYIIESTIFSSEEWSAQIVGLSGWLRHKYGNVYSPICRRDLGDEWCGVNLAAFTANREVDTVVTNRLKFVMTVCCADLNWWRYGKIVWGPLTANSGIISEVKEFDNVTNEITLQLRTPHDFEAGDNFDITAGCDKTFSECKSKFTNGVNFGGYPDIPGSDQMLKTPNAH